MPFSHTERTLSALELLAGAAQGLALSQIAVGLQMPKSGAHRLMAELIRTGYVAQHEASGTYHLTPRMVSLAFRHLAAVGVVDAVQPVLDGLAALSGELVRLSVTDGTRQVWVAKAQGARSGLIYDPQMGDAAHLASMATGLAWLATMDEVSAVRLVTEQGLSAPGLGPNAPRSIPDFLDRLRAARTIGVAQVIDCSAPGMSAIAAPVMHPVSGVVLGTLSIGGPSARLDAARLEELTPALLSAVGQLTDRVAGSSYFLLPPATRNAG